MGQHVIDQKSTSSQARSRARPPSEPCERVLTMMVPSTLTLSLPKATLTKPRKLLNPGTVQLTKPKGVTIQMKALDEYFLMVVFTEFVFLQILCLI